MKYVLLFLASLVLSGAANAANPSVLAHKTVRLFAPQIDGDSGIAASGFPIDKETIMTAGHFCASVANNKEKVSQVIEMSFLNNNDEIAVLGGGRIVRFEFNEVFDLCLIKLPRHGVVPVKLANYAKVKIGQKVMVVGAPMGLIYPNITDGYVTQKYSEGFPEDILNGKLLTSAPAFPGNSGGPVFNEAGEVVGVLVMGAGAYEHLSFSVPADLIRLWLLE